jgi:hypothetical protein
MNKRPSKVFRVDEKVYLTMGAICILSVVILAFRYSTSHPCAPIKIESNSITFAVGSPVNLKAETKEGKTFDWSFGDGSTSLEYDPVTLHTYAHAGKYTVSCTVDGQCTEILLLVIKDAPLVVNTSLLPQILVQDSVLVNKAVVFEDISITSTSWEWSFGNRSTVDAMVRKPMHTFSTAGPVTVYLRVNGRGDLTVARQIFVIDPRQYANANVHPSHEPTKVKPTVVMVNNNPSEPPLHKDSTPVVAPPKVEEKPKAPTATNEQMEDMLMQVVDGSKTAADFASYLCNNLNLSIVYNGKNTTFSALCNELRQTKKKKIKKITVSQYTFSQTGCVYNMVVTLDKKSWFP